MLKTLARLMCVSVERVVSKLVLACMNSRQQMFGLVKVCIAFAFRIVLFPIITNKLS